MHDLKPDVVSADRQGMPANNLIRFSEDFGGETNYYQGFDVNIEARFRNGAFLKAASRATSRTFDNCNLLAAGSMRSAIRRHSSPPAREPKSTRTARPAAIGSTRFRPDVKLSGSYTLPWERAA